MRCRGDGLNQTARSHAEFDGTRNSMRRSAEFPQRNAVIKSALFPKSREQVVSKLFTYYNHTYASLANFEIMAIEDISLVGKGAGILHKNHYRGRTRLGFD
jgi:hypothetical protein